MVSGSDVIGIFPVGVTGPGGGLSGPAGACPAGSARPRAATTTQATDRTDARMGTPPAEEIRRGAAAIAADSGVGPPVALAQQEPLRRDVQHAADAGEELQGGLLAAEVAADGLGVQAHLLGQLPGLVPL